MRQAVIDSKNQLDSRAFEGDKRRYRWPHFPDVMHIKPGHAEFILVEEAFPHKDKRRHARPTGSIDEGIDGERMFSKVPSKVRSKL